MKKTKTYGKANNKFSNFKDEYTLAQLIQNAAARGLASTRGALFRNRKNEVIGVKVTAPRIARTGGALLRRLPKGAVCACAMGAQALTPKIKRPIRTSYAVTGNDYQDEAGEYMTIEKYADQRSFDIGAAYEHALRPD